MPTVVLLLAAAEIQQASIAICRLTTPFDQGPQLGG